MGVAFDPTIHDAVGTLPTEPAPAPAAAPAPGHSDAARHAKPTKGAVPVAGDEAYRLGETSKPSRTAKAAAGHDGPTVVQVMRAGYKMKSKVLRPAMVFVGG